MTPNRAHPPSDLSTAKALVHAPCGFTWSQPEPEPEGADYAAHTFTLDGLRVRYREARTTPTKAGQFVFPLEALRAQGVVSTGGSGGKRAFRVCPPWVTTANRQAEKAQSWQVEFLLPSHGTVDPARARALYLRTAQ